MFPSTEARSPDKKPGACMDLCEDQNSEEPYHSLLCIGFRQDLFCHLSSWIRGAEDNLHLFHPLPPISNIICIFLKVIYISFFFVLNTLSRSIEQTKITTSTQMLNNGEYTIL